MSQRVQCSVEETDLIGDKGKVIPGVVVTCGQCGHQTESFGQQEKSIKRCLVLLREECPENSEENFYVAD